MIYRLYPQTGTRLFTEKYGWCRIPYLPVRKMKKMYPDGSLVVIGVASGAIMLTPGTPTDITVAVKGSDGVITNNYTLHVQWALPNWQDSGYVAAGFAGGDGSLGNPFQIATAG